MEIDQLAGVEQTLLIPLIVKAEEYQRNHPILKDRFAFELVSKLNLKKSDYKIVKYSAVSSLFRSVQMDCWVTEYISENPSGLIIEIGSGLDFRFRRVDNGSIRWINIELPAVVQLRNLLHEKNSREINTDEPLENIDWKKIAGKHKNPLIISEGVFPYFVPEYARKVLKDLRQNFAGSILCFDTVSGFVVKHQSFRALDKHGVSLQWGMDSKNELYDILPGCTILDEWRYYDRFHTRNGWANFFHFVPFLNNLFRIYRVRLS